MTATRRLILRAALGLGAGVCGLTGAAYAFQRDLLYDANPGPEAPVGAIQAVSLTTRDRQRLTAWYLPPRDGRPVFLYLNGRIGGLAIQKGRWRRMAREGVGFLAINYRGYGGSSGHPTEWGLHLDARAGYAWLARRYPARRIVIHGYSLGSGVAVRLAAKRPARALILEAPFTALADVPPLAPVGWLLKDHYASRDWIGRVRMPLLVVHGDKDTITPFDGGRRLFALANEPKTFVRIPGGDHNTLVRDGLYDHVWPFLGVKPLKTSAVA
jgi:fermentation-respiration switch protein FrsA (DUF1100 family)